MQDIVAADPAPTVSTETIPIVHEVASIGKRKVESGRARVTISVTEHDQTISALLMRQDLAIERVAIGRTVPEAPPIRREGDVIVVPVMEEVLFTEKRLVLREELHIRINETRQDATETVTLRREHAQIDRDDMVAGSGNPRRTS